METLQPGENIIDVVDAARLRYPASEFHPVLVTEVTQMRNDHFCVAAYDIHARRMVRPLRPNGENWIFDEFQEAYHPAQLLNVKSWSVRSEGPHPHSREDMILKAGMVELAVWTDPQLYAAMLPSACYCIAQLFDCRPLENRYVVEGTECPSLGGIKAVRASVKFLVNRYNQLRLQLEDADGESYNLPVTCDRLRTLFKHEGGQLGTAAANRWLEQMPADEILIVRVGLGRGYAGIDLNYNPRRCFVQINGILTGHAFPSLQTS